MKYLLTMVFTLTIGSGVCLAENAFKPKDSDDKISYSVGYQMGSDFKKQKLDIRSEVFLRGIQDALSGAEPAMTRHDMEKTLVSLKKRVVAIQQEQKRALANNNLTNGKTFLDDNAKKDGIKILPSGLQYQVITEGKGNAPKATDTVTVHYRGTLINGTEFDSSYSRNQPATFALNRVITGWTEGLQLMKPGAKYKLFLPPDLAYGERGAGAQIGPNSTLIFEVELIDVKSNN